MRLWRRRTNPDVSDGSAELARAQAVHRQQVAVSAEVRARLTTNHLSEAIIALIQGGTPP